MWIPGLAFAFAFRARCPFNSRTSKSQNVFTPTGLLGDLLYSVVFGLLYGPAVAVWPWFLKDINWKSPQPLMSHCIVFQPYNIHDSGMCTLDVLWYFLGHTTLHKYWSNVSRHICEVPSTSKAVNGPDCRIILSHLIYQNKVDWRAQNAT